jgi:SAM-dependent methyltransferase
MKHQVKQRKYFVEYHIPEFAEFERWRGKRVLEIGGGICTTATSFAEAGANITVVELSPKSMELCKQRFKALGLFDRATFFVGNAENLSSVVPVETYDLIWSFGVIHHSPNPESIVSQIRQVDRRFRNLLSFGRINILDVLVSVSYTDFMMTTVHGQREHPEAHGLQQDQLQAVLGAEPHGPVDVCAHGRGGRALLGGEGGLPSHLHLLSPRLLLPAPGANALPCSRWSFLARPGRPCGFQRQPAPPSISLHIRSIDEASALSTKPRRRGGMGSTWF